MHPTKHINECHKFFSLRAYNTVEDSPNCKRHCSDPDTAYMSNILMLIHNLGFTDLSSISYKDSLHPETKATERFISNMLFVQNWSVRPPSVHECVLCVCVCVR